MYFIRSFLYCGILFIKYIIDSLWLMIVIKKRGNYQEDEYIVVKKGDTYPLTTNAVENVLSDIRFLYSIR